MRTITHLAHADTTAPTLAILLPCAYGTPEDFQREGFISTVHEQVLDIDIVLADMNLECITSGDALTLLRDTVITRARNAGYKKIILVGISIGGFMAISYANRYPNEIDGLCLIAPYLGSRIVTNEISIAGGILDWSPDNLKEDDHERLAWQWLKTSANHSTILYLGFGNNDRFAQTHKILADLLTPGQVAALDGNHDWNTWKTLWDRFLESHI